MQAAQQQVAKPTEAQIQAQIENMHWQEKQQELSNAANRQQMQWQQTYQQQSLRVEHQHYMVDHLANPITILLAAIVIGRSAWAIARASINAGIEKNKDDNTSDVRRAQEILDKHEASA